MHTAWAPGSTVVDVSNVDLARLKRIRAAVASALEHVPEKSASGLTPTYVALRDQVIAAVPEGLRQEVGAIAPTMNTASSARRGAHDIIGAARDGAEAYAQLAALKGWLDAVIDAD